MKIQFIRTEKKVREFSKNFIVVLCVLWIIGALYGMTVTWRDTSNLSYLLDYLGQPMVGGVIGYMAKSALENREKVKKSRNSSQDDTTLGR